MMLPPSRYEIKKFCSRACALPKPTIELLPDGLSARIPLRTRFNEIRAYVLVDAADAEWVNQTRWSLGSHGYAGSPDKERGGLLHRRIMGLERGDRREVDHINRDKLDNRRCNLRIVSRTGNAQNVASIKGSSSKFRGVSWDKRSKKWAAQATVSGKHLFFGYFDSEEQAAHAALHGRKAHLPFAVD